jgi:hypothetical protein
LLHEFGDGLHLGSIGFVGLERGDFLGERAAVSKAACGMDEGGPDRL